ncbi:SDR family NAD(P)-dependent oxidoreductase [Kineosporia babensis]|uniref:SDR family oxidoreductase n=1 Tax=Kineosporia babensis TaxID=499548 RepID=A0A9X1NDZ1_9ACTN|nr:SDR family oxidoreductase [Kineosporia babensis]MCD5312074.1 SDR family oxidoreductase [Kineosporia babensis]
MTDLSGRKAFVTGASGGIGAAICARLQADGATVWALDARPATGEQIGTFVEIDVKDAQGLSRVVRQVIEDAGGADILVTSAGVVEDDVPAEELGADLYDHVMGVNLRGVFLTCQAFGRTMLEQGSGSIVNIASMSGNATVNFPQRQAIYNASKAGVSALTRSLAVEWGPRGVRVNALSPGYIDTPLNHLKAHQHQTWKDRTPLGRFGTVEEVAAAVSYLSGPEAGFYAGAELLMDGGYSLW